MGKASKKKQRDKRKQKQQRQANSDDVSVNPSSAVHQLRHADPKIRQGALIALQATFLHQPASSKKQISLKVLQAIREQVMDANLECASAAAECLAQYLSLFQDEQQQDVSQSARASWTLIFISRLNDCRQGIQAKNHMKYWCSVAAPCLRSLCKLIEINELALEQVNSQKDSFLETMFGLLHDAVAFSEAQKPASSTEDVRLSEWMEEIATYTARALHSSFDDNLDIVQTINLKYFDADRWVAVLRALPTLAQLHLCGAIVNCYQAERHAWQLACIMQHVLPILLDALLRVDQEQLRNLEENYRHAQALYLAQKEDDELEQEIVKKIEDRKESARTIARRLKELNREGKASMETDAQDGEQAVAEALVAWNSVLMPVQVALEVIANMISCLIQAEDGDDAMDMGTKCPSGAEKLMDQSLYQALQSAKLAEKLVRVLDQLCLYQNSREKGQHEVLNEDLNETISKSAACTVNCVLSKVLDQVDYPATWQVLRNHATAKGISSALVVISQKSQTPPNDLELARRLLQQPGNDEEIQRDAICLLVAALTSQQQPVEVVREASKEMIRLMTTEVVPPMVKMEVLNAIMDLYGQDDFYPDVFTELDLLTHFQRCLTVIPKRSLEPEQEEILCNADGFVDYKMGR